MPPKRMRKKTRNEISTGLKRALGTRINTRIHFTGLQPLGQGVAGPAQLVGDALLTPHLWAARSLCGANLCGFIKCRQQASQHVTGKLAKANSCKPFYICVFTHSGQRTHFPLFSCLTKANQRLRFDYGQLMIAKMIVVSRSDVSSDAVDVSVAM